MNKEEYDDIMKDLHIKYIKDKHNLYKRFAMENNKIEKGDIIESGPTKILVEHIEISLSSGYPLCVYAGPKLTAKLIPYKNRVSATINQSWPIKVISQTKD